MAKMIIELYYVVEAGKGFIEKPGTVIPVSAFDIDATKMCKLHPEFTVKDCIEYYCKLQGVNPKNYIAKGKVA